MRRLNGLIDVLACILYGSSECDGLFLGVWSREKCMFRG